MGIGHALAVVLLGIVTIIAILMVDGFVVSGTVAFLTTAVVLVVVALGIYILVSLALVVVLGMALFKTEKSKTAATNRLKDSIVVVLGSLFIAIFGLVTVILVTVVPPPPTMLLVHPYRTLGWFIAQM